MRDYVDSGTKGLRGKGRCCRTLTPTPVPTHTPDPTYRVLLCVLDGLGVVAHEGHSEEEVDNGEDGVQPKEVVAGGKV